MNTNLILASTHLTLSIIQFMLAGLTFISNPKAKENRAIAALLSIIGLVSFSIGSLINALSYQEASIWMFLIASITYIIGPATLFVSLIILQPKVASNQIVSIFMWSIIITLPILAFTDFIGLTTVALGFPLIYSPPSPSTYFGGYPDQITGSGQLRNISVSILIATASLEMIYPTLYTFFKERRSNPRKSRLGLLLFLSIIIAFVASTAVRWSLPELLTLPELISNLAYALAFAFAALQGSDSSISGSGFANIANNFPVRSKLLVLLMTVLMPSIAITGVFSLSFLQSNVINLTGETQYLLAANQADYLREDIESHIDTLDTNFVQALFLITEMNQRDAHYASMDGSAINQEIQIAARQWEQGTLPLSEHRNSLELFVWEFMRQNTEYTTVIVTDSVGAMVAGLPSPSEYVYNTYYWWRTVQNTQRPYLGISEDPESNKVILVVPMLASVTPGSEETYVQGYIYAELRNTEFYTHVSEEVEVTGSSFEIFTLLEHWVPLSEVHQYDPANLTEDRVTLAQGTPADDSVLLAEQALIAQDNPWNLVTYGGSSAIISWDHIQTPDTSYTTDWTVVTYVPTAEALQAIIFGRFGTLVLIGFVILGAYILASGMSRFIILRLQTLTDTAENFSSGDRSARADVTGEDEIGILAKAFNQVTQELEDLVNSLETTINDRTQALERRASQFETSALVASEAASIRDPNTLMKQAVQLIPERFGYYHAGIFLVDDRSEYAVLQAANSPGGQRMLARGHKLQIGKVGVVGFTAGMGEARIAQDVGADVVYYDNPDMPDTLSELALPLKVHDQVIGVLDVQSNEKNAFQREDLEVLQVLADQIALAIESARLLYRSEQSLTQLERLYGEQVSHAWRGQLEANELAYRYTSIGVEKIADDLTSHSPTSEKSNLLSKEIEYRGQEIGKLELIREDASQWTQDELELVDEILEQTALALENARLVEQIRLRSDQIQLLQEITALSATSTDEIKLLQATADRMQRGLSLRHCGIVIFDEKKYQGTMVADATRGLVGESPLLGDIILLEGNELTLEVISTKEILVIYDVENNPRTMRHKEEYRERGTYTLVIVPLVARGEAIGTIGLDIDDPEQRIDEEDLNLLNQISAQVSSALDQIRLFQAEQRGREAASALLEITQIASSSLDLDQTLKDISQRSAAAIQAHRCMIALYNQNNGMLAPAMAQFAQQSLGDPTQDADFKRMESVQLELSPVLRQLFTSRQPAILSDPNVTGLLPESWVAPFNQTKLLMVPMFSADNIIGLMAFDQIDQARTFDQSQVEVSQTIAGQVATTIANASLFEQTVRRAQRERTVAEISTKVRASNDPQVILQTAVSELRQALGAKHAQVHLDPQEDIEADSSDNGKS